MMIHVDSHRHQDVVPCERVHEPSPATVTSIRDVYSEMVTIRDSRSDGDSRSDRVTTVVIIRCSDRHQQFSIFF
ncbi:hypothetical protein L484_002571 [Morus notabilis]|uniref:Uncharacterized protein n=1 Tax=Morus notabilis TaxID=981085 RepID=W9QXP1_9ROSA|nr:hypothetical protein L484_002571 [Morus notabilis]